MSSIDELLRRPRRTGIACAIGAVLLGLVYMMIAGAPTAYLVINAGACVLGLLILAMLDLIVPAMRRQSGAATFVLALGLLATALLGDRVDGAARWIDLGVLYVQPSLILLPIMIVGFARSRDAFSTAGLIVAAVALAIQPDRAMAGMLTAGLATLVIVRRDQFTVTALFGSIIAFAATLLQVDGLPAMPFVEQILYSSFDNGLVAGLAVLGGSIVLVVPAILGWVCDIENRHTYAVFGAIWIAAIAAAAVGNYPTPVVGYSGGAVLGYVLSLTILPTVARSRLETNRASGTENVDAKSINQTLRLAAGCPA
ncbi:MAG: hypothetical protein HOP13_18475 [Alphaproteobacteria bacterium]|nr:hypothetical protein [Alphaproteobacteria bacterium]